MPPRAARYPTRCRGAAPYGRPGGREGRVARGRGGEEGDIAAVEGTAGGGRREGGCATCGGG